MSKITIKHLLFSIIVVAMFILANFEPKTTPAPLPEATTVEQRGATKYTPYQILIWEIKANEGYQSWWYKDGIVRGKQAYAIGFGWNDQGNRRRNEIKEYTRDHKVTYDEAMQISLYEIDKYGKIHVDPLRNVALQLYSYSRGPIRDGRKLGRCCNGTRGCGRRNPDIRAVHNRRRTLELALWNHEYAVIDSLTEINKGKVQQLIQQYKN